MLLYQYLADSVVVLHGLFVLFAVLGGFLVLWKTKIAWFHIPAAAWAAVIEISGWICPLTPLENYFRKRGGVSGYETGFVEHYIVPLLYPESLTRKTQIGLGLFVICLNLSIYMYVLWQLKKKREKQVN